MVGSVKRLFLCLLPLFLICACAARADALKVDAWWQGKDTLNTEGEADPEVKACLEGLRWARGEFKVRLEPAWREGGDWLVRFPSPVPVGDRANDAVAMEWRMARDEEGQPKKAPALVVIHESGRGMTAARVIARGMNAAGFHTFLLHLPGYGARFSERAKDFSRMLPALRQAIADARRARDAVAALPFVDASLIGLQGTSLGGFVSATVGGLDRGYDRVFILLAGGNLINVIEQGTRDAATFRKNLKDAGITPDRARELIRVIEPMRLASRVDPQRTWLFSGSKDEVVPPACSREFAKAARLGENHRELPVGHYSAAFLMPVFLNYMTAIMEGKPLPPLEKTE